MRPIVQNIGSVLLLVTGAMFGAWVGWMMGPGGITLNAPSTSTVFGMGGAAMALMLGRSVLRQQQERRRGRILEHAAEARITRLSSARAPQQASVRPDLVRRPAPVE
jgi:hypothetical protein